MSLELLSEIEPLEPVFCHRSENGIYLVEGTFNSGTPNFNIRYFGYSRSQREWYVSGPNLARSRIENFSKDKLRDLGLIAKHEYEPSEGIYVMVEYRSRYDMVLGLLQEKNNWADPTLLEREIIKACERIYEVNSKGAFADQNEWYVKGRQMRKCMVFFISADALDEKDFLYSESLNTVYSKDPKNPVLRKFRNDVNTILEELKLIKKEKPKEEFILIAPNNEITLYQKRGDGIFAVEPTISDQQKPGLIINSKHYNTETKKVEDLSIFVNIDDEVRLKEHGFYKDPYQAKTEGAYVDKMEYDKAKLKLEVEEKKLIGAEFANAEKKASLDSKNIASISSIVTVVLSVVTILVKWLTSGSSKQATTTS